MTPETPSAAALAAGLDSSVGAPARGLSRRSLVRAGVAAAWAAPVVTLVTAAPAMAVSSTLTVSGFTATYQNNPNAATVNPHILVVNATLGNSGSQATTGFQFVVSIPAGLFDAAPTATAVTGFSGPSVSGSLGAGWTLVFTKSGVQLGAGGSVPFATTITLGSRTASPYLGYRGSAFALVGTASASNATTVGSAASVATTPNAALNAGLQLSSRSFNAPLLLLTGTTVRVSDATTSSRSGIGQLFLSVSVPKGASGSRLFAAPTQGNLNAAWATDGTAHTPTAWVFKYKTVATGYAGSLGPSNASRGPGVLLSVLQLNGGSGTPTGTATWTLTAAHLNATVKTSTF